MNKTIEFIKTIILKKFPALKIIVEYDEHTDEYFIVINDEKIYLSKEFAQLMDYINFDYLLKKGITNIFIVCDPDKFISSYESITLQEGPFQKKFRFEYKNNFNLENNYTTVDNELGLVA